jgi:hypothetical protein
MWGLAKRYCVPVAGIALLGAARVASAVPLAPGGIAPANALSVSGTLVVEISGSWNVNLGTGGTQAGNWVEDVVTDSVTGNLDFLYQVTETGNNEIVRVTVSDYILGGLLVDTGWANPFAVGGSTLVPGTGTDPVNVDRSANARTVGFQFQSIGSPTPIQPPGGPPGSNMSAILVVKTDAKSYQNGQIAVIDGTTVNIGALGPAAPLPATASMGLGLFGVIGAAGGLNALRRRRLAAL